MIPYLPHLALLAVAIVLVLRTPETHAAEQRTAVARRRRRPELREQRFRTVVLPLAPWVFGSAAIALAYLPGLVQDRLGTAALAFTAVVTMLTALAGILVQPLARRIDAALREAARQPLLLDPAGAGRARRPSGLCAGLK